VLPPAGKSAGSTFTNVLQSPRMHEVFEGTITPTALAQMSDDESGRLFGTAREGCF